MLTSNIEQEIFLQVFSLGIFLIAAAFFTGYMELNAEGKRSFAWDLKTWFRVKPKIAVFYQKITGGVPLTGYHLGIVALLVSLFFSIFFASGAVSLRNFIYFSLTFVAWMMVWDFTWYLIHPEIGKRGFNKENPLLYMYRDQWWFLGFPAVYWTAWTGTIVGMIALSLAYNDFYLLLTHLVRLAFFFLYLFVLFYFGGRVGEHYKRLLETDERYLAPKKPPVKNYVIKESDDIIDLNE